MGLAVATLLDDADGAEDVEDDDEDDDDEDTVSADSVEVIELDAVAVTAADIPLVAVGEALLDSDPPFEAALAKDSAIELSGGHKFVVCTSPRSKWKQSNTAAPTELRRATIELTIVHLLRRIS